MNDDKEPAGAIEGAALPAELPSIADVIGPGKTKGGKDGGKGDGKGKGMKLKADPKQGKRLSKKSKTLMFGGVTVLSALIILGVATSGNKSAPADSVSANSTDQVGMSKPPAPSASQARASVFAVRGQVASAGSAPAAAASGAGDALAHPQGATLQPGRSTTLTPAQKYRQWLVEQHYKDLEGKVLAAQSAHLAKTDAGGVSGLPGVGDGFARPGGMNANPSSPQDLLALQHQLAQAMAQNPQAANDHNAQSLMAALGRMNGAGMGGAGAQSGNQGFLDAQQNKDGKGYLQAAVQPRASNHELFAGSVIPAVLQTGIDSDLPGTITGMVRQTVYDSLNPNVVLIPQGTKIIGAYSSDVAYGQSHVLVSWNRLIFPNGAMIDLKGMSGTDGIGQAGLHDQTDNHYARIFGSAILMSLLGVGAQLSQPQTGNALTTPSASQQAAGALAQQMNSVGTNLLNKNLNIQPTLNIRPGYTFNVLVNRTMILPPYSAN